MKLPDTLAPGEAPGALGRDDAFSGVNAVSISSYFWESSSRSCEPPPSPEPAPSVVCDPAEPASPSASSAGFDDVLESWDPSICLSLRPQKAEFSRHSSETPPGFHLRND